VQQTTRFRVTAAARMLDIHPARLRRLDSRNVFSSTRTPGGHRTYNEVDLVRIRLLLEERQARDALVS